MAEDQAQHRRSIEKTVVDSRGHSESRGQFFAFVLGMTGVVGAVYLVSIGMSLAGFAVFLSSLGSLMGAFIYVQRRLQREQDRKGRERPTGSGRRDSTPAPGSTAQ